MAPDGSARANFIAYGAITTNFWVKDKANPIALHVCDVFDVSLQKGDFRDILLGFDNHVRLHFVESAINHH